MLNAAVRSTAGLTLLNPGASEDHLWGWLIPSPSHNQGGNWTGMGPGLRIHLGKPGVVLLLLFQLTYPEKGGWTLGGSWLHLKDPKKFFFKSSLNTASFKDPGNILELRDRHIVSPKGAHIPSPMAFTSHNRHRSRMSLSGAKQYFNNIIWYKKEFFCIKTIFKGTGRKLKGKKSLLFCNQYKDSLAEAHPWSPWGSTDLRLRTPVLV